jgi:hypothetical protein
MRKYKNATPDQANEAFRGDPKALENLTREHFRRRANRGEMSGKVISGGNIETYASKLPHQDPQYAPDLEQATIEFLERPENANLRKELTDRLVRLREALHMPEDSLTADEINDNPWQAAQKLKEKATATLKKGDQLLRAAEDFVNILGNSLGKLKPDMIVWDPAGPSLKVVDATHTVNTSFEVFHQFKTMVYARVFEMITGVPTEALEFRSPQEQRVL